MLFQNTDRKQWSWALYDWASSSFSTTIMAGFFPLFFRLELSKGTDPQVTTARLGLLLTIAGVIVALSAPFWGTLSDRRQAHKTMLLFCVGVASLAIVALSQVPTGEWLLASLCFMVAVCAFEASQTFYDALLNVVAPPAKRNQISALGYSLGYLGGGLLFLLNVAMYLSPGTFGIANGAEAVRASFITVVIWWILFAIPLFLFVPSIEKLEDLQRQTRSAWAEVIATGKKIWSQPALRFFLIGYWLYIDGVFTVMNMAVDFGLAIGLASQHLIGALLLVQFIGFPAALASGYLSEKIGAARTIFIGLAVYLVVLVWGVFLQSAWQFYVMASLIGLVQGGVQSISRALFSQYFAATEAGEYFGFYNLLGRFAAILGPTLVALTALATPEPRFSLTGLALLFCLGAFFLHKSVSHQHRGSLQ